MGFVAGIAVPHPPLIIPGVGLGSEREIQDTVDAYHEVARLVGRLEPDVVVVSSPHAPAFSDAFNMAADAFMAGSMSRWRSARESVEVPGDAELADRVSVLAGEKGIPCGDFRPHSLTSDHGSFIPLWFLAEEGVCVPTVIVGLSGLSYETHVELGRVFERAANELGRRAVWVASGDLSHKLLADGPYGFAEEGPAFDKIICELFSKGELGRLASIDQRFADAAAECGLRSFQMMAGALEGKELVSELLAHQGTFGVGYGVASFVEIGEAHALA